MKRRSALLLIATLSATSGAAQATDDELKLHPIAGLFGLEHSSCEPGQVAEVNIAPAICSRLVGMDRRQYWGHRFSDLVTDRFGATRIQEDLAAAPPAGLTRDAMLSRTLITSLHVSRAALWTVPRPSAVEVHMPVTVSLLMTNVLTGEVVFSHSLSTDVYGLMPRDNYETQAAAEFDGKFDAAIARLVNEAGTRFTPGAVKAQVKGRVGERFVVDAGLREGLREGDQVGLDARVVFADDHYAIVEPVLGDLQIGQTLTRYIAQPVEALDRPSILVVIADTPKDFPPGYATVLLEDALANTGGFSLVTVNPASAAIREPALNAAKVSRRPPALPDFFLRATVAPLDAVQFATNIGGVERRVQDARVYLEVVNRDGRVVFATEGKDQRVDEISDGMAPSTAQRRDAAVRNAMLRAAQALKAGFSPGSLRLDLKSADGDEVVIEDRAGVLGIGLNARVIRSAGRVSGIEGNVWTPITDVAVVSFGQGTATARQADVETARVRGSDKIVYQSAGTLAGSRYRYSPCLTASNTPDLDLRGEPQPLFQAIAFNKFASGFPGAVYPPRLRDEAARLGLDSISPEYAEVEALRPVASDYCFVPVHQLQASGERPSGRNFVQPIYDLTIGYVLRLNGQRVGGSGVQQQVTATAVPVESAQSLRTASLQTDLANIAADLARRAATEIKAPE